LRCGLDTIVLNALRKGREGIELPVDEGRLDNEYRKHLRPGTSPIHAQYTQDTIWVPGAKTKAQVLGEPMQVKGKTEKGHDFGFQLHQLHGMMQAHGLKSDFHVVRGFEDVSRIREAFKQNLTAVDDYILINYLRSALGEKGGGHISPIGAYDPQSDSFLIVDVSPVKNWVWVKTIDLVAAMATFDTIENRGYLIIRDGR